MYKIIGADHNEYGPSSADEIRQWIKEGRADGRTLVKAEGSNEWKPLSSFPEFADTLPARPPAFPTSGPIDAGALASQILAASPYLRIGECLGRGWKLLMENFGLLFGTTVLVCLVQQALLYIPHIGVLSLFFKGVFYGGLYLVFLKRIRGQPTTVGEGFSGFGESFVQLLLAGIVGGLLTFLGLFCCLFIPGIYLFVAWTFAFPLVADKRLGFWDALELSRKVVTRCWFQIGLLIIVAFLPFVLVFLYSRIEWLNFYLSLVQSGQLDPTLVMRDPAKYFDQVNQMMHIFVQQHPYLGLAEALVLLLVQPFGKAVLMQAYEVLFNPRSRPPA